MLHMASQGESPYAFFLRDIYERPEGLTQEEDALCVNVKDRN